MGSNSKKATVKLKIKYKAQK